MVETADAIRDDRCVFELDMRFADALRIRSDVCGRDSPLAKTTTGEKTRAMSTIVVDRLKARCSGVTTRTEKQTSLRLFMRCANTSRQTGDI